MRPTAGQRVASSPSTAGLSASRPCRHEWSGSRVSWGGLRRSAHCRSQSAAARKHDGRAALGIKAKLFLAFGGMAMLTGIASAVAWYAFTDIDRSVTRITAESIVGMAASLRLAEKSAEITATAPALIASRNEEDAGSGTGEARSEAE